MSRLSFRLLILILSSLIITASIVINWSSVSTTFQAYDIYILNFVNSRRIEAFDPFFILITNTSSYVAIGFIFGVFIVSIIKRSVILRRCGLQLLSSFLLAFVLIKSLKYRIGRIRPFDTYNYIEQLVDISTPSFPSGHTLESAAIATAIVLLFKNRIMRAIAILWALGVAFSRIILGVHYPSDVVAGILIGILSAYLCHRIFHKRAAKTAYS
jgi:membrane-associated phospholipid phosphatase